MSIGTRALVLTQVLDTKRIKNCQAGPVYTNNGLPPPDLDLSCTQAFIKGRQFWTPYSKFSLL